MDLSSYVVIGLLTLASHRSHINITLRKTRLDMMNLTCPWKSSVKRLTGKSLRLMKERSSSRLILLMDLPRIFLLRGVHPTAHSRCHLIRTVEMTILKADECRLRQSN